MDATAPAALEAQLRRLTAVLERLATGRHELVPATATFWRGSAREAYDRAVHELDGEIGATVEIVSFARQNTLLALAEALRDA
jgi:hypothetical protein